MLHLYAHFSFRIAPIIHQRPLESPNRSAEASSIQISDLKTLLRGDLALPQVRLIHTYIASQGWEQNTQLSNHIISMYGKCWATADSRSVFDSTLDRDIVSWNAMIAVYAKNGYGDEALHLFENIELNGMEPDPVTFISALQTCADPEDLCQGEFFHAHILKCGFEANSVVFTALLYMYGKCGALESAHMLFQKLQTCETVPWNAMIAAFSKQGYDLEALDYFYEMLRNGIKPDMVTFVSVVSACASLQCLDEGKNIHGMIREFRLDTEVVVGNALITMYGRCMAIEESRAFFDGMQHRDLASWNAMLGAYYQALDGVNAMNLFDRMQQENVKPDKITFVSLISVCESLGVEENVNYAHMLIVDSGYELDMEVGAELLNAYVRCGAFEPASVLFNRMPKYNLISWNTMISIHAQQGHIKQVLDLVHRSQQNCIEPDNVTFVSALTSCRSVAVLDKGRILHAHILKMGCECDTIVGNALVSMYGKCEALKDARLAFDKMSCRNVVTWNAIMDAHVQLGQGNEVTQIFRQMQAEGYKADEGTYVSVLCGCACLASLSEGRFVHAHFVESGLKAEAVQSALMIMYEKCGTLEDAEMIFNRMNQGSVVGWNTILSVYTLRGHCKQALLLFRQMQELGVTPNKVTLVSILNACASLNALEEAQVTYKHIALRGLESNLLVATALMTAYGKCGALEDAHKVFDGIQERDVVAWNVLISVYGQQGHGKKALEIFREMVTAKVRPNDVTFVNLLSSCSHAGLLEEGQKCFLSMSKDYGIKPTAELYGCMVDLLGRAGQLGKAEDLISTKSLEQDVLSWSSLLGACNLHGDMERGKRAAESIVDLEAQDSATYVLLANMCTSQGL
eukprot:c12519_g1_i1 orf=444-3011(-)